MSSRLPLLALAAGATLLAGCAAVDPGMGEAVKYDALAQTVNPDPAYPAAAALAGSSGDHGSAATERYRKGQVKEIVRETTASGGSGSSGSGPK